MAEKLHGLINLSKIDKSLIATNAKGEKVIWCDILEKRNAPDQYGNTHTLTIYNKERKETIYLGDFKPQEFGKASAQAESSNGESDDLPWDRYSFNPISRGKDAAR